MLYIYVPSVPSTLYTILKNLPPLKRAEPTRAEKQVPLKAARQTDISCVERQKNKTMNTCHKNFKQKPVQQKFTCPQPPETSLYCSMQ